MCGRARCTLDPRLLRKLSCDKMKQEKMDWKDENEYKPTYNAAPTCFLPVITYNRNTDQFGIETKSWGFTGKLFNINCRYETWKEKFGWKKKGLLLINGFYEWNKKRETFYIHPKSGKSESDVFFVGVLYDSRSFSILTTSPSPKNEKFGKIHNRIPLIIENPAQWIRGREEVQIMEDISYYRVSDFVNKTGNNSKKCVRPFQSPLGKFFQKKKKKKSSSQKVKEKKKTKKRKRDNEDSIDDDNEPARKKRRV